MKSQVQGNTYTKQNSGTINPPVLQQNKYFKWIIFYINILKSNCDIIIIIFLEIFNISENKVLSSKTK